MKILFKKISSFTLLLAGSMPVMFTLFFLFKQQIIRHEMREKLEEQLLSSIVLPESEVEWTKYKKEISINDKLFDVKTFTVKNGVYTLIGLYDDAEAELNKKLSTGINEQNEKKNQLLSELFQLLQSAYPGSSVYVLVPNNDPGIQDRPILLHIPSAIKNILTPPPRA